MATTDRRGVSVSAIDTPMAGVPNANLAIKTACLVATTANITLSGLKTIDGVAVGGNAERVLVWKQTDATTNGLYNASSGNWTRTTDANSNLQWADGMQVAVNSGATWGNRTFLLQTADPITLGSSAIVFAAGLNANITVNTTAPLAGGGAVANNPTLSLTTNSSLQVTASSALAVAANSGVTSQFMTGFNSAGIPQFAQPQASALSGRAALTVSSDTNITLTLGGTPNSALLAGVNLTVAWTSALAVSRGGTSGTVASGTLLDNITGFSNTGIVARTGAGAYSFYAPGQIPGSTTSAAASAGNIGEVISASQLLIQSLTNGTALMVCSAVVTAGNWDIWGDTQFSGAPSTTVLYVAGSINTNSAALSGALDVFETVGNNNTLFVSNLQPTGHTGIVPATLSASVTYYLVAQAGFGTSTAGVIGRLFARRRA